jgi:hypothetical protein
MMTQPFDLPARKNYRSYLLRMWCDGEASDWRASLQDTATQQNRHFASLDLLVDFLYRQAKPDDKEGGARMQR